MSNKLEWSVEEYFVKLFGLNETILDLLDPATEIRHFDDDDQAESDCLVVQAVQGERLAGGAVGAFHVELRVLLRSFKLTSDENEQIMDAVVDAVYDPAQLSETSLHTWALANLSYLYINDEMSGERSNTKQTRKREKIFPLFAKGA